MTDELPPDLDDPTLNRLRRDIVIARKEAYALREEAREEAEATANLEAIAARHHLVRTTPPPNGKGPHASTWAQVDLRPYLAGEIKNPSPTRLLRADGVPLLYDRKLHWISGEPESGKSWVALVATAECLHASRHASYVDFETDPLDVLGRLLSLGVDAELLLVYLHYFRPQEPMDDTACSLVLEGSFGCQLGVIDGVNAAMSTSGFDPNSAKDFYRWWQPLGAPLMQAVVGPMVAIDHVIKDSQNRGAYASGTGQKLAAVDVHLGMEKIKPFGLGLTGSSRIVIHKDRPGMLRQHADGRSLATFTINASDGTLTASIDAPQSSHDDAGGFRPTALMERVSRYLEEQDSVSQRGILEATTGNRDGRIEAIRVLLREHWITSEPGPRNASLYRSIRPFRQPIETTVPTVPSPFPHRSQRNEQASVPPFPPPPLKGGTEGTVALPSEHSKDDRSRRDRSQTKKLCPEGHVCSLSTPTGSAFCCGAPEE